MAKTTSQIVAENKAKRAEEAAIGRAREAINQKQLSTVSGSIEKTKAVLKNAIAGTTDAQKKANAERAYKSVISQYNAKPKEPQKSAVDQMWERASSTPQKTEMDDYRKRILDLQKQLTDAENAEIDWTSAADRQENARRQEELQSQIDKTRDEMNYRANMGKIDSMSEEQKQDLETLANSDNGFLSWMNIWDDQKALKALQNPEENEYAQRFGAEQRLKQSGIGGQQLQGLSETYQREMNRQDAEQAMEEARQKVQSGFGGAVSENAAAFANNLAGSVTGTLETADQAVRRAMGKSIYSTADTNRPGYRLSQKAAAAREATSEQILGEDPTLVNKAANLLYKGGTSAVDNVLRGLAGGGTAGSLALAGMGSFQDSYRSAAERGADDSTALLYGSVTAALEVATEFLPTEHLLGAKSAKECESLLRQAFVQAGLEIPGEEISLWGEIIADAYIMGDKSENSRLRAELIANGYSKEQADNEVMRRNLMESAETALTTLVSSGGSVYVQGKVDSARNKLADMEARGLAANNAGQAQNLQQETAGAEQRQESPAAATTEADGLTDAQRYFRDAENGKTGNAGIEQIIQQTADELSDNMPENKPVAKTDEQARLDDAMQRTILENQRKQGEQEVYEALKAARKGQKELQKEISRAERRLAETGKGSRARIDQLKAKLEQQDGLVRQLESQSQYFTGNYERTVGEAVQAQEAVFADAKSRAAQAISDYEAGRITEAQKNAEVDAYNRAGAELKRLMGMTQEQYRADLAEAGLAADLENTQPPYEPVDKATAQWSQEQFAESAGVQPTQNQTPGNDNGNASAQVGEDAGIPMEDSTENAQNTMGDIPKTSAPVADTQNASMNDGQQTFTKQNPGIKGTGAAEQNFSGKAAYQDLLSDENAQRDRPGDVRPMEVPKEDGNGRKVSEFAGNAYGAEVTPDRMANEIESLIQDGALGFDRRSNKQSLENAQQYIYGSDGVKGKGEAGTRNEITKNIANGKIADGDIEKAMLLYAKYANGKSQSSQENAAELMVDLATMANMTGRNLQLFKILRRMTPEGQLMAVKKTVERNVESLQRGGKVKKGYSPDIDPQLMQDYKDAAKACIDADSPQKQKEAEAWRKQVEDAIYVSEAAKMPATFKAKWDAWRYMCMLGNAKTQARNIAGNASFMPYKAVKDKMGALLEKTLPKEQRTKSLTTDNGLLEWARADAKSEEVQNALKYSAKLGDDVSASKLAENQKVFNTEVLEEIRKFTEKIPAAGDMLFKNPYYSKSLAGFLRARGYSAADVKSGNVDSAILNEARGYAIEEAMKATFNDSNSFSDFMANGLRYKGENPVGKILNTMAEGVLPFRRTPANIIVRFTEYSPIGVGKSLWNMATKVRGGEMTAATAIDQISAGLTGTGAMMLGYALANGLFGVKLTGSGLSEDEKRQGHQEYALEFSYGGKEYSYKIDWAAPANMPLFVGANIRDLLESRGADTDISKFTAFIRGMGTMFEPMLSLSCLSGLNEILESVSYADSDEKLYALISSTATSYFMQGVPTLARQASQAMNENKRVNFSDSTDPTIRDIQKTAAQIPFIGNRFKTDKVTPWGDKESAGGTAERVFNSFLNPGTLKEIDNGPLEKEITRLNGSQPENVTPPYAGKVISYTDKNGGEHLNQRLTEEQYQTLSTVQGQTAKMIVEKMLKSSDYQALTDAQKAEAVKLAYEYAKEKGRGSALEDYPEMSGWMAGIDGKEGRTILQKVARDTLQSAVADWAEAIKNGWDTTGDSDEMESAYKVYDSMSLDAKKKIDDSISGDAAAYLEIRSGGVATEKYISVVSGIKSLKPEKNYSNVRDIQIREEIAENRSLSAKERDIVMKAYMPDYDPKSKNPQTTELKYDEVRKLGVSAKGYSDSYRDYLDASGSGKRRRTIKLYMDTYGWDRATAQKVYDIYAGYYKPWKE